MIINYFDFRFYADKNLNMYIQYYIPQTAIERKIYFNGGAITEKFQNSKNQPGQQTTQTKIQTTQTNIKYGMNIFFRTTFVHAVIIDLHYRLILAIGKNKISKYKFVGQTQLAWGRNNFNQTFLFHVSTMH